MSELPDATETTDGIVELATTAEVITGTDTTRAVTAAGVQAVLDQNGGLLNDISGLADPGADRILFWDESANDTTFLTVSTGLTISGTSITTNDSEIAHDSLSGFVANEHIDHTSVDIIAGTGLTGGGDISASRTLNLDISSLTNVDIADTDSDDSILVQIDGNMRQMDFQDMGIRVVNLDANQTFALGDANTLQVMTGTGAHTWTIPSNASVAFNVGTVIYVAAHATADDLTIDPGTSVTLTSVLAENSTANRTVIAGGTAALIKVGTNDWLITGDIS